jgi:hypothetical protein
MFGFRIQSELRHSCSDFVIKKLPPPTPDRREGRLFPPEQSWKTSRLLNELPEDRNKFYLKKFNSQDAATLTDEMNDEIRMTNEEGNPDERTNEKKYGPRPASAFVFSHLVINATS